ncbi:MAG: hypothetical protein AB9861_00395 [Methanosarcina sp.]
MPVLALVEEIVPGYAEKAVSAPVLNFYLYRIVRRLGNIYIIRKGKV